MPTLNVTTRIVIPEEELHFSFARSGGPGGQNVNKVNSKATLRWNPSASAALPEDVRGRFLAKFANRLTNEGEIVITSQKSRDQPKNVADCLEKLREMLAAVAVPPKKRRPTNPSRASKKRRLADKKAQGAKKEGRRGGWGND